MSLSTDKLLLPDSELTALQDALANTGYPDVIPTAIEEAEAAVAHYTAAYTLTDADKDRLARPLVIKQLYTLIGAVSNAVKESAENAMKELKEIRDGKFPGLTPASGSGGSGGVNSSTGAWGDNEPDT